jgi:aryl-alcohol dehydrogenase-like predicted oxidoreductase
MQGILTGAYATADEVPVYRARSRHFDGKRPKSRHGEAGHEVVLFEAIGKVRAIASAAKISMAHLALAWPLHQQGVCTVIAGVTKDHHIASNATAAALKLSPEVVAKLNAATDELKMAMGGNADLWQGGTDGRIE